VLERQHLGIDRAANSPGVKDRQAAASMEAMAS